MSLNLTRYFSVQYTRDGRKYPFLNCWGLIMDFYQTEFGITLNGYTDYEPKTMTGGYCEAVKEFVEVTSPQMGDVIAFFRNSGILYHVGVFTDPSHYLHCEWRHNCQISALERTHERFKIYRHRSRYDH